MNEWQIKKLGEVCEIARGGSPRPINAYITDSKDGINWIKISDATISDKYIHETKEKITKEGLHKTRMVYPGDFILTNSMSFGRPYIMKTEGAIHDGWLLLRPDKSILDEEYLYHFLSSDEIYTQFKKLASGAVVQNLNSELVRGVEIILPPLATQKEIVVKLDEKMTVLREAKQLREQALADTSKILSQTLHEIFEEGKKKGWEEKLVGEISEVKGGKRLPKGKDLISTKTIHPYLRVTDFKNGILNQENVRFITDDTFEEIKRYIISSNDIFVSIAGTIGLICRIPENFDGANLTENAAKITNIDKCILKDFLYWQLMTDSIQKEFNSRTIQTTISKLALFKIAEQKILVPPLTEQEKIVAQLDTLSEQLRTLRELQASQLADMKRLEKAYLREAFKGEL